MYKMQLITLRYNISATSNWFDSNLVSVLLLLSLGTLQPQTIFNDVPQQIDANCTQLKKSFQFYVYTVLQYYTVFVNN